MKKRNTKILTSIAVLVLVCAGFVLVFNNPAFLMKGMPTDGTSTITSVDGVSNAAKKNIDSKSQQPHPAPTPEPKSFGGTVTWDQVMQELSDCSIKQVTVIAEPQSGWVELKNGGKQQVKGMPTHDQVVTDTQKYNARCGGVIIKYYLGINE